jgi:hypothetical protein
VGQDLVHVGLLKPVSVAPQVKQFARLLPVDVPSCERLDLSHGLPDRREHGSRYGVGHGRDSDLDQGPGSGDSTAARARYV